MQTKNINRCYEWKDRMNALKFKFACFKVKRAHKRVVKCRLNGLKLCLHVVNKIGMPINKEENEVLDQAVTMYDEILKELKSDIDRGRRNIALYESMKENEGE